MNSDLWTVWGIRKRSEGLRPAEALILNPRTLTDICKVWAPAREKQRAMLVDCFFPQALHKTVAFLASKSPMGQTQAMEA